MKFEVKVQYKNASDEGKEKTVSTVLLINTDTFGDAEVKAYKVLDCFREVAIKTIKISKIDEVLSNVPEGVFFECGFQFLSVDEKNGKSKQVKNIILVQSENSDDASKVLKEHLGNMMVDYEIVRLVFSQITEIV